MCTVCNHPERKKIEQAVLLRNYGDVEVTLSDIAKEFGLDLKDLQVHSLMHIPLEPIMSETAEATQSIASEIKRREAQILANVMEESYITFKNVGNKINSIVSLHNQDEFTLNQITKAISELYLGTAQSIRDTAEKLMKMNLMVNGEKDAGISSLAKLAMVLQESK